MKKVLVMPALAAVLVAAACEGVPSSVDTTANVRFFNATTGLTDRGGFTANGQFASGSALAMAQAAQTCSKVDAGTTSFGFGAANTGGTGLSGNLLATLTNQSITPGGEYILASTGSAVAPNGSVTSPKLFLLDTNFTGTLAADEAAVRFVNLAPTTGTLTSSNFNVWWPEIAPGVGPVAINLAVGDPMPYRAVKSGDNTFTVAQGHFIVIQRGTVSLQAGSVNTFAIVPGTAQGTFRVIQMSRC